MQMTLNNICIRHQDWVQYPIHFNLIYTAQLQIISVCFLLYAYAKMQLLDNAISNSETYTQNNMYVKIAFNVVRLLFTHGYAFVKTLY